MKRYNALNRIKFDLAKAGICSHDGLRFTDPLCTHATSEQIEATRLMDAEVDIDYEMRDVYGKNWENNADKLHAALVNGNEWIAFADAEDGCGNDPALITELRNQGW